MGEFTIIWPDDDLEKLAAAKGRLEVSRRDLLARSDEELIEPLAQVMDLWSDPASAWREELLARHPEAAGMSRETVAAGLETGLADWSGDALRALVARELEPALRGGATRLVPFELTSVLLAGSIPMPSLLQCLLPLVLRSPTLVRPASRDLVTPELVAASISAVDSELGRAIEVVSFESDDRPCLASFLSAECVVASGSDETIADVRGQLGAHQRFVGYGHRLSLAVLGSGAEIEQSAQALSRDVANWDQLGCLSPVAVFVVSDGSQETEDEQERAQAFAAALARELAERERETPRGPVDKRSAAVIANERAEAELRGAGGRAVTLHGGEDTRWTVVCEDDSGWRPAPQHRFVRVHPAPDLDALARALRPLAPHLAAVALDGFEGEQASDVERRLLGLGASRLCRPGQMQAPPLDWHHDGRPVLLPLARFADSELG